MTRITSALVTGASGFIGQHLCRSLKARGVTVRALMRTPGVGAWDQQQCADIAEKIPVSAMDGVDTVFHLAGKAHALSERHQDADDYRRINTEGTVRLFELAKSTAVKRFIFFSSVKVMGEGGEECQDEDTIPAPETPYGFSKLAAERQIIAVAPDSDLHVVILRLPKVYGAGCGGNLSRMLSAVDRGRFPPLAKLDNQCSMIHVHDVVKAAMLVALDPNAARRCFIITDGATYSTTRIYEMMRAALGRGQATWTMPLPMLRLLALVGDLIGLITRRRFAIDSDAFEKLTTSACYQSSKIRDELGFANEFDFELGLPEMIRAYRNRNSEWS